MSSLLSSAAQIEGKSFDLSSFLCGNDLFVKILEKGTRKSRWISISVAMARWMHETLGSAVVRVSRSTKKKRFGRAIGWVKVRSNNKGRFVELGFALRGRSASVFVPGKRTGDSWASFREALAKVLDRRPRAPPPPSASVVGARSFRDVTLGTRPCPTCGGPWKSGHVVDPTGRGSDSRPVPTARGCTRQLDMLRTAREDSEQPGKDCGSDRLSSLPSREAITQPASHDKGPSSNRVRGDSNGLELSYNGGTIQISLDVGQFLSNALQKVQQALTQDVAGFGQSILSQVMAKFTPVQGTDQVQNQALEPLPSLSNQVETDNGAVSGQPTDQGTEGLGLGNNAHPLDAFLQYNPLQALDRVFASEVTSSFGDSSCDLRDQGDGDDWETHVSETPSVDLHGTTLFDEEAADTPAAAPSATAGEDAAEPTELATTSKGDGILPTPAPHFTLGNEEADTRGNNLMKVMGLQLVDTMGKEIELGTKTYSRRKTCRELENLKTSINYDGRGLRKGFLNRS